MLKALNINHYDALLYPHMKERLGTFCDDYFTAPELYEIEQEEELKARYTDLQLRDTSELRLDQLCLVQEPGSETPAMGATATYP